MADAALYDRLFLLDGSSLAFRAFFALPESITTRDGFPTNALYGLSQMLLKIVAEYRPAGMVCAWDARGKTFRHEAYEAYKAQRPPMPDALSQQWERFPELLAAFGVVNLVKEGYEADDILGTLAEEAKRQGVRSIVVTGDRDAMQLVDDDIWVMSTGRGVTDVKIYTPAAVVERFGIVPASIPDYIGLKGDTSDNIPGVPGVGEKTAAQLLQQFGSIEAMYERLDEVKSDKRRALLAEHEADARFSKMLATMVLDVPLEEDLVALVASGGYSLPVGTVDEVFARFEFTSLRRRLHEMGAAGPAGEGPAPAAVPAPAAGVRLVNEPDVGPLAAALEKDEAAVAMEPAGDGDGWVVAVHRGGEVVQLAAAPAERLPALWLLAAHAVVHDAKAQPGYQGGAVRAGASTRPWPPTCWRPSGPRSSAACSRSPAPRTAPCWSRRRRPSPPPPRARCSPGRWPRSSAGGCSSSASSACSARSSCRSCTCWRGWRRPASRSTRTASARSRRACATASTRSATRSGRWPAASSPSARRSSWPTCCSTPTASA